MKKFLAMLLALVMVFSLAACGDSGAENTGGNSTSPSASQPGTNTGDPGNSEEVLPPATLAPAEAIDYTPLVYFDFESTDGLTPKTQIINMATWVVEGLCDSNHPITLTEDGQGAKGKALYMDGKYGLVFDMPKIDDDIYTISFWYNCEKATQFAPVIQMGRNISGANTDAPVTWINFTKVNDGTWNTADIFPVVWNRNSSVGTEVKEDGVWPWLYAMDNQMHGEKEWCMVTVVVNGNRYIADDGIDRIETKLYLNGIQVWDANAENMFYQGISPEIFKGDDAEGFIGINYWDLMYKGFIDEFYVYGEALTDGQVATLFEQGNPPATPTAPTTPDYVENEAAQYTPGDDAKMPVDESAIATLGTPYCVLGWWSENTDGYELADGATLTAKFNLYSDGAENFHTLVTALTNTAVTAGLTPSADNYDGYAEYAVIRSDAFGWGDASYAGDFTCSWDVDWASWLALTTDSEVEIVFTRAGGQVTMDYTFTGADGTVMTEKAVISSTLTADGPCYVHFTGEGAYIELLSIG